MRILCMHIVGLIPFKSSIDHPMALLCFFNTSTSLRSCTRSRCEFMMARHLLSASRKTYFKFSGSCFNSAPFLGSSFFSSTKGCLRSSHRFCLELFDYGTCLHHSHYFHFFINGFLFIAHSRAQHSFQR